ncbi:deoxynucleotidyltransferase terminal-interacting protein 1 [Rhopalosiphum padi]|uniref:deoxynucleotidyltransferase terminal-interacting protein 1 n=1 Tax=Rhopalosiphum padi TaxID=40932 RepID=UPI00298E8F68|nr:deoxynucleotidyltransferase terminal-interacting protein 1 [Rhopalosiphum padi]
MVVHKLPIKHLSDDQQIQQMVTQQPTNFHRSSKPVPLVRQAPVFDLEVITSDNFVPWKNTFNMRQVTLANIIDVANGNDKATTKAAKMRAKNLVNAAKSLDLLRQNLQNSINKDIDNVIKKYLTSYFGLAIDNVKNNLGSNCVTEDHVREVCRTMLDEAKLMYSNPPLSGSNSPFNTAQTTDMLIESRFAKQHSKNRSLLKRKEPPVQEAENNLSPTIEQTSSQTPLVKFHRFQSTWDPVKIHSQTLFVLATRAANKRGGRMGNKHPELFQYTIDMEDRDWLMKQKMFVLPPPTSVNATSILLLDDVQSILSTVNQKNNPHELKGFELPEFILNKVRSTMILNKPPEMQSHQQIIITENGEIEEQPVCSITLNENTNSSITQSHSESSSIIISGTSTTLAEALNMLEYGERLPQHNEIPHSSPNNNTGLATTHSTLTALLAAENNFMPNSSQANNTQFGM